MELMCMMKSNDHLWWRRLDDISAVDYVSADLTEKGPLGHENPPNAQNNLNWCVIFDYIPFCWDQA
jgi:hypothetical protein